MKWCQDGLHNKTCDENGRCLTFIPMHPCCKVRVSAKFFCNATFSPLKDRLKLICFLDPNLIVKSNWAHSHLWRLKRVFFSKKKCSV